MLETLQGVFGHASYRTGQATIIDSVLERVPTLAILPTGAGKSLCYQLPALLLDGVTLVISPLIALIRDQVAALHERGVRAASISSADVSGERSATYAALRRGELDLLYVAPERLRSPAFLDRIGDVEIAQVAIDEAHCISQWGHDFRPDYARLGEMLQRLQPPRVLALTATATAEVRQDILRSLGVEGARTIVSGFDRPNLELSVEDVKRIPKKLVAVDRILERWLGRRPGEAGAGCAIVYAATRRRTEEVAEGLTERGWRAAVYHAGLPADQRSEAQEAFRGSALDVVVATTAFGMGVDKSDVRVVVHFDIPSSPESYYQEVGRAGRDGEPAGGVLLFDTGDLRWAFMRLESSCPTSATVDRVHHQLRGRAGQDSIVGGNLDEIVEGLESEVGPSARAAAVALDQAGAIRIGLGGIEVCGDASMVDRAWLDRRERVERGKLNAMVGYVSRALCRRRYLVDYFGDPERPDRCGACDRCALPGVRALEGEALIDAQKALSCVARMRGRYGRGRAVDVLLGSRAKSILDAGLDRLSTYGLLKAWSKDELLTLFDSLARAGLVAQTQGEYPKLLLTDDGAAVLRERSPVQLDLRLARWGDEVESADGKKKPGSKKRADVPEAGGPLFEAFRQWRSAVAKRIGMPPYVVAHDKTLAALAAMVPQSDHELAEVPGIGPAKIEAYGAEILAIVREHCPA